MPCTAPVTGLTQAVVKVPSGIAIRAPTAMWEPPQLSELTRPPGAAASAAAISALGGRGSPPPDARMEGSTSQLISVLTTAMVPVRQTKNRKAQTGIASQECHRNHSRVRGLPALISLDLRRDCISEGTTAPSQTNGKRLGFDFKCK